MISRRLPATLALALPLTALAHAAQADCQDTGTVDAPVITCDLQPGFETDGIDDNRDDLTVEVLQGAVVTATGKPVVQLSGSNGLVDNAGTISGSGDAIVFENTERFPDLEIVNQLSGSIVSTAGRGINGEDFLSLENKGLISAQGDAVRLNGDGFVESSGRGAEIRRDGTDDPTVPGAFGFPVRRDSARIESATGFGIVAEGSPLIINFGQIDSFKDGIRAENGGLIANGGNLIIAPDFFSRSADARITVTGTQIVNGETVGFAGINVNPTGPTDADAIIDNFGEIVATGPGIVARGDFTSIQNFARIESLMDDGVRLDDGALLNGDFSAVDSTPEIVGAKAGVNIDSGFISNSTVIRSTGTAPDSAGIRVDGVDATGNAAATLEIDNGSRSFSNSSGGIVQGSSGTIRGMIGILFDDASTAEQQIFNAGVIEGVGGTAIRFAPGQGASTLTLVENSQIIGDVMFGGANDLLVVEQITSGVLINSTFDGGGGFDTADLSAYSLSDLSNLALDDDETLSFDLRAANGDLLSASFTRFEAFILSDTSFGPMSLPFAGGAGGSGITPIPVPPALPLLGAAVAGLALVRRRAS